MNRLRYLRMKKGISLRDLAEKTNISYPTLSRLENGNSRYNEESLIILTSFFDVSIDYLLDRTDDPFGSSYNKDNGKTCFDDFTYMLYDETRDLSDEQRQYVLDMVRKLKEIMKNNNG